MIFIPLYLQRSQTTQTGQFTPEQIKLLLEEIGYYQNGIFEKDFTNECFTNVIALAASTEMQQLCSVNIFSLPKLVKELLAASTHLNNIYKIINNTTTE